MTLNSALTNLANYLNGVLVALSTTGSLLHRLLYMGNVFGHSAETVKVASSSTGKGTDTIPGSAAVVALTSLARSLSAAQQQGNEEEVKRLVARVQRIFQLHPWLHRDEFYSSAFKALGIDS